MPTQWELPSQFFDIHLPSSTNPTINFCDSIIRKANVMYENYWGAGSNLKLPTTPPNSMSKSSRFEVKYPTTNITRTPPRKTMVNMATFDDLLPSQFKTDSKRRKTIVVRAAVVSHHSCSQLKSPQAYTSPRQQDLEERKSLQRKSPT